jgi:hypothetical protein
MGGEECIQDIGGKAIMKGPLGRPKCRQEDNIKMDSREDGVVCTGLIWLRAGANGGLL